MRRPPPRPPAPISALSTVTAEIIHDRGAANVSDASVSVVIPNWNGRRWLAPCLAALAGQELAPAEVIVVDNGSDDGSPAVPA